MQAFKPLYYLLYVWQLSSYVLPGAMQDKAGMLSQNVTPRRGNCFPSRCYQLVFFDFYCYLILNVRACSIFTFMHASHARMVQAFSSSLCFSTYAFNCPHAQLRMVRIWYGGGRRPGLVLRLVEQRSNSGEAEQVVHRLFAARLNASAKQHVN